MNNYFSSYYGGKKFDSLKDLAKYLGIKTSTSSSRVDRGCPKKRWREISFKDKSFSSIFELAKYLGISKFNDKGDNINE